MSISTSHDRLPQRLGQQILPRDDSDQLVVMIGDAKKSKTQRAKKSIRPLNRSRFVDGIGSGIGIGPEVDPSLSIAGLEFDGFYRRIFRILPFDRFPLDERQESFGFQKSIGGVAILVVTEGPSIEQSAQHGATRGPIKDAGDRGIDDGKVAVRSIPQKIVIGTPLPDGGELPQREQVVHVGLPPRTLPVPNPVQRRQRHHGAKERPPRQARAPITRPLLETEQHPPHGTRERRRHPGRGAAADEVALVLVVSKVAHAAASLREEGRHAGPGVDHGPFHSHGEAAGHGEDAAEGAAEEGLGAHDAWDGDAVEVDFDFGDAAAGAEGLEVREGGGEEGEEGLAEEVGEEGGAEEEAEEELGVGSERGIRMERRRRDIVGAAVEIEVSLVFAGNPRGVRAVETSLPPPLLQKRPHALELPAAQPATPRVAPTGDDGLHGADREGQGPLLGVSQLGGGPPRSPMAEVEHRLVGAPDFGFVGLVVVALEGGRKRGAVRGR
mmetsp:Transcript_22625/g.45252  ORF Transcript_22625/g.45252 Transcript_22625/m.45252 type:complete len:496 (+) Transcript_22625:268-1755(+)